MTLLILNVKNPNTYNKDRNVARKIGSLKKSIKYKRNDI